MLVKLFTIVFKAVPEKHHDSVEKLILFTANAIDVLAVLLLAGVVGKLSIVFFAVLWSMVIRIDTGEHYDSWLECLFCSLLTYTIYAYFSHIIGSVVADVAIGFLIGVFMIDFKSEKAQGIIARIKKGRP